MSNTIVLVLAILFILVLFTGCVDSTGLTTLIDKQLQGAPGYATAKSKTLSVEEEKKVDALIEKKLAEDPGLKERLTESQEKKLKTMVAEDGLTSEEDMEVLIKSMSKPTQEEIRVQKWLDENKPVIIRGKTYELLEIQKMGKDEKENLAEEALNEEFEKRRQTEKVDTTPSKEVYNIGGKAYGPDELSKMSNEELKQLAKQLGLPTPQPQSKEEK